MQTAQKSKKLPGGGYAYPCLGKLHKPAGEIKTK